MSFLNRCIWTATSAGTVDFVVSSAAQNGYIPANCLDPVVIDGGSYHYFASNGTDHEEGDGIYHASTSTLTRTTIRNSSNSGSIVNFAAAPVVVMGGPTASDIRQKLTAGTTYYVSIASLGTVTGGSLYTDGEYNNVSMTGGTGTGFKATVIVAGGAVTTVLPENQGSGYVVGDVLSAAAASIGGTGSGFSVTITALGSDSHDGLTALTPFLHIQKAIDTICDTLDCAGFHVTISVADGVYAEEFLVRDYVGAGKTTTVLGVTEDDVCEITGNTTTPTNCRLIGLNPSVQFRLVRFVNTKEWVFGGFSMRPANFQDAFEVHNSTVTLGVVDYGPSAGGGYCIWVPHKSIVYLEEAGATTFSGGPWSEFMVVYDGSWVHAWEHHTIDFNADVSFSVLFDVQEWATIDLRRLQHLNTNGHTITGIKWATTLGGNLFLSLNAGNTLIPPASVPGDTPGLIVDYGTFEGVELRKVLTETANYTLSFSDGNKHIYMNTAGAVTVTLPNSFPPSWTCYVHQEGAGTITFAAATGATLHSPSGVVTSPGQYSITTCTVNSNANDAAADWRIASVGGGGISIGEAVTSGTTGSVLFIDGSGNLAQDNTNFFWDDTNEYLKVGHTGGTSALYLNGSPALFEVPNASGNNWFEGNAGNFTVTGAGNFATGDGAGGALTTGGGNFAIGGTAAGGVGPPLGRATTADGNVAVGGSALATLVSGTDNFAIGAYALERGVSFNSNCAVGNSALRNVGAAVTGQNNNCAVGSGCFENLLTGGANTGIGTLVGIGISDGVNNTWVGNGAGFSFNGSCNFNTILGSFAGTAISINDRIIITGGRDSNLVPSLDCGYVTDLSGTGWIWSFNTQRVNVAPVGLHVYNSQDNARAPTNYERALFDWNNTANVLTIGTQAAGTGTVRDFAIVKGANTFFSSATTVVGSLPAAGVKGRRHFVTDATATTFASIVAGGGANNVPVYDDGTNWRIG